MSDPIEAPAPVDPTVAALIERTNEMSRMLKALGKPGNADPYLRMLDAWEQVDQLRALVQDCELDMRLRLFAGAFANPKEGTNSHKLPDGRVLKGQHKINRYINEEALAVTLDAMRKAGVANTDALVRYKPELAKSEWNTLSDEMKLLFSPAISSKPGTPSFEITIPKKRGA